MVRTLPRETARGPFMSVVFVLTLSVPWAYCQDDLAPGETLLYQCDFDENVAGDFTVDPYKQGAELSAKEARGGQYSLCCRGNQEYYQYFGRVGKLPLRPGRTYRLRVWSKVSDKPLVIIHIFFHRKGNLTSPPRGASIKVPPSKEWHRNDLIFTVPPDLEGGELRFRFCTAATDVIGYFDDLSLVMLAPGLKADYQCSSKEQVVTVEVNVADFLERESLPKIRTVVELIERESERVAARQEVTGLKSMVSKVVCPIGKLRAGAYDILVEYPEQSSAGAAGFRFGGVDLRQPLEAGNASCTFPGVALEGGEGRLEAWIETGGEPVGVGYVTIAQR